MMIKIMIADDHAIVREGLKQLFLLYADLQVTQVAVDGAEVLQFLRTADVDLLLLDMTMPGIHGIDLITRIRVENAKLPILVLSMHNEPQIARRALLAGASGYLTKDSEPEVLLAAIRKIASGGKYIAPELAEAMLFDAGSAGKTGPQEILSEREFNILNLLVRGISVNQIADELFISNKTVSTHKARLMQKLNLQNNTELVRYGIDHHLI
jgi:DNA-binding NarL/FixJ family response regulator